MESRGTLQRTIREGIWVERCDATIMDNLDIVQGIIQGNNKEDQVILPEVHRLEAMSATITGSTSVIQD